MGVNQTGAGFHRDSRREAREGRGASERRAIEEQMGFTEVDHPLLGQRVVVTLARDPLVTRTGVMRRLTDSGEIDIQGDSGETWYCWPALEITRADG